MRIGPILAALRRDPVAQRSDQQAIVDARDEWLASSQSRAVAAGLAAYGAGSALPDSGELASLLSQQRRAGHFADRLMQVMVPALREARLGHVPFRHQYSGGYLILQLLMSGRAALSLAMIEGDRLHDRQAARSVCFSDGERHEIILAGQAQARIVRRSDCNGSKAVLSCERLHLRAGTTIALHGNCETKLVDHVPHRLVSLRLSRTPELPGPSREYRLSDGALIHQASGDLRESQLELAMAVLGKMGRRDAAPALAQRAMQGNDHHRWQALRECLALDAGEGFAALDRIARDARDPLSPPALALRAQLLAKHPELERIPCPA
ncbi:MAG: hypothetical protein IE933_05590 [Sphingomonadales bacterium]|nr:hypothetical protein [Sphingomonadales bacterium]MBD3773439.1 hypothetical protein [Paracoccaceae bacterium]